MAQPTQTDPQFKLRLTADLKDRIQSSALSNNRSMNAEILASLEVAYPRPASSIEPVHFELLEWVQSASTEHEMLKRAGEANKTIKNSGSKYLITVRRDIELSPTNSEAVISVPYR